MKIEYKINSKEYIKLMFFIVYRKRASIVLIIMALIPLLLMIYITAVYKVYDYDISTILILSFLLLYIFVGYPLSLYLRLKKTFYNTKLLQLNTVTEFTENKFSDTAESFYAEMDWKNLYKIEELKSWFLFYINPSEFGFCPKRVMTKDQILELRKLVKEKVNKVSLKEN